MFLPPYLKYKDQVLTFDGVALDRLATRFGSPTYIYSELALLDRVTQIQQHLKVKKPLICFSAKSNSNLSILRLLAKKGLGLDLVSGGELFRADHLKIPGNRLVFSGVGKTTCEIQDALAYRGTGIACFNVESLSELRLLNKLANPKKRVGVALRFNPDVDAKTHPYISTGLKKNKFGLTRQEILSIAKDYQSYPNLDLFGVSIHIGSQLLSLKPLEDSFLRLKALVQEVNSILPLPIRWVDLGGGLGIQYEMENAPTLVDYCKLVTRHFGQFNGQIVLEPGRALIGNAGLLLTRVLYLKKRNDRTFVILDSAMTDLIRPALYGSHHKLVPVRQTKPSLRPVLADIVGGVCESSDCFETDAQISPTLKEGDWVALLSTGAYGFTMASNYNSRPRPAEILLKNGHTRLIRKRESYQDLIVGENH